MPRGRTVAAVIAWTAAVALGALNATSNLQTVEQVVPPRLRAYLPLLTIVGFSLALVLMRQQEKVDGVLYRENIRLRQEIEGLKATLTGRHLTPDQQKAIADTGRAGLAKLNIPNEPPIEFISIGTDRETLDYLEELASTFGRCGFTSRLGRHWDRLTSAAHNELSDGITVLQLPDDASNAIRKIVIDALRAASIEFGEKPYPGGPSDGRKGTLQFTLLVGPANAFVVVGHRR